MIKWLFHYSHVEDERETANGITYNLVLEHGEYDLEQYFRAHFPPQLESEQVSFWRDLFLVAKAIKGIHNFTDPSGGSETKFYGYVSDH